MEMEPYEFEGAQPEAVFVEERRSDAQLMHEVAQLLLWLQEVERATEHPLDICDLTQIYNAADKLQNNADELRIRRVELERLRDEMHTNDEQPSDKLMRKTEKADAEATRIADVCRQRQVELERLISQMTGFLSVKTLVENWLQEAKSQVEAGDNVTRLDDHQLRAELSTLERLMSELGDVKEKIGALNDQGADLLKQYRRDECHKMSHALSVINALWTKFNDNIRIRRAALEASLTSRDDFGHALDRFEQWLADELKSVNERVDRLRDLQATLVDAASLKEFVTQQQELASELEAHTEVFELVNSVGGTALEALHVPEERQRLKQRLNRVRSDWEQLIAISKVLSERVATAQKEHDQLQGRLVDAIQWVATHTEQLQAEQVVVGDPALIQRQSVVVKELEDVIESKEREVQSVLADVRAYLMRHDLRPQMQTNFLLSHKEVPEEQRQADFVQGVRMNTDCEKLERDWAVFVEQLSLLTQVVRTAHRDISDLNNALAEALLTLSLLEAKVEKCKAVEKLQLDQLKDAHTEALLLTHNISEGQLRVEDVNDAAGKIQAQNIALSSHLRAQVQAVNLRCRKLKKDLANRKQAIERALKDFGPSSEHFMLGSVKAPWQRAISQVNMLPYYIDHAYKTTQWDHPAMVSVMENLAQFNQVKFCTYRLAMKLRAIQKTACLDLVELADLKTALAKFATRSISDTIQTDEMTMCLLPLFEDIHARHPDLLPQDSVILAVDLTMNLIFNIYDPCRDAVTRVLSFEVALVILCKAELPEKYKYLFQLVSSNDSVDHKQLAVLFYELIQIPKFLGEAAVFGGSNVEPSVRSCFSASHFPNTVSMDDFLKWLKMEPQSFIWLPVLHRVTSSESIKHEAKCNVCKMYPLIGLRYRCMRCLNFDICQNCFFSQRSAKNHKLAHPVLEYCVQTTSKDDLRDFGSILLNKFRPVSHKTGYLPLETVFEGQPIEIRRTAPVNPESELIHRHIQLFALRLGKAQRDESKSSQSQSQTQSEPRAPGVVKSPLQLVLNVEQMEKDELDNLLQKLRHENRSLRHSLTASKSRLTLNTFGGSSPDARRLSSTASPKRRRSSAGGTGFTLHDLGPPLDTPFSGYNTLPAGFSTTASARPPMPPTTRTASTPLNPPDEFVSFRPSTTNLSRPMGVSTPSGLTGEDLHDYRLEQRQRILIEQNRLLQRQLQRLKKALEKQGKDSQSPNAFKTPLPMVYSAEPYGSENEKIGQTRNVDALINTVGEIGQAMETFVVSVAHDDAAEVFDS